MMKDVVLSLIQMRSAAGDIQGNFERMRSLADAVKTDSDIICFPEACLTGYDADDPGSSCISLDDEWISKVSDLSKKFGLNIVFGFMEKNGRDMHITQALSDRKGNIGIYRKTHLGRKERKKFVPGNEIPVFELPEATIGIQLCWESHFPDLSSKLRKKGADIILISYASPVKPPSRRESWMKHLPARAYDNGVFVGAVNAFGDNGKGVAFGGGIMVFDPKGDLIAEQFFDDDSIVKVKLSSSTKNDLGSGDDPRSIDYFAYRRDDIY